MYYARSAAEAQYPELWHGLVGAWCPAINPPGGTVLYDWGPYKNHGTLTNMETTDWDSTLGNGAIALDGSNEYVAIANSTLGSLPGKFTLEAWINTSTVALGARSIIGNANSIGSSAQYAFEINRTAKRLSILANGGNVGATSSTDLEANKWYHVAVVKSGASGAWTFSFYVNGSSHGGGSIAVDPDATQQISIGRPGGFNGQYFSGSIAQVVIRQAVATQSQMILATQLGPAGMFTPRRRRRSRFSEAITNRRRRLLFAAS